MPAAAFVVGARDEDLMLAYAAGDATAFDALYARHRGGLYRYLLRHCGQPGIADELFQDIWLNAVRARSSYVPTAKFTTWLYRIAHNRLIDHWRATGAIALVAAGSTDDDDDDDDDPLAIIPGARSDEPEVRAAAREISLRLRSALAALPPAQRDVFLLHQEGGLELSEIAELTGAGMETVKSRLRYALAKLRAELGDLQ
jgi:RNA polymerase sigma-70 factor (ECF subfamily)